MTPILYAPTETDFTTLGIGTLTDCVSCQVTEERNGPYELTMEYSVDGAHYKEIKVDAVVKAQTGERTGLQLFRIYAVSRPIGGIVTVNAEHVSYQLNSIPVSPFAASSAAEALGGLTSNSAVDNPFSVWTDVAATGQFAVTAPSSFRSRLGGVEGSVLDVYGGEYEWDNFAVKLHAARGRDDGVSILYGKNLIDLKQEESIANLVTGVYPYWTDGDGGYKELPEKIIALQSSFAYPRVIPLDLSAEFEEQPPEEELRTKAEDYIDKTDLKKPKVSITVSFIQLWQTEGYKDIAALERVGLCDTVTVRFDRLGVDVKAKIVKTVYDCLQERYISMDIGDVRSNLADTITEQQAAIKKTPSTSFMQAAIDRATKAIAGAEKGCFVTNPPKDPQEALILDKPGIENAEKLWRWNMGGFGYSKNGYAGPYETAITMDGEIVADFITTGILTANLIKAGVLQSLNGVTSIDMETGKVTVKTTFGDGKDGVIEIWTGGITLYKDGKHMGSFYASTGDEGIAKANQFILAKNDSTAEYGRMFLRPDGKSEVQGNWIGALDGFLLGGVALELKTATIGGTTITYLGR